LAQIASGLRTLLNDPYSVRDFAACPARFFRSDAEPAEYIVNFALNVRNRMGGYGGRRQGIARFRQGRLIGLDMTEFPPYGDCPRVPDEEIQRLISAG
jgi:hypothetical protein